MTEPTTDLIAEATVIPVGPDDDLRSPIEDPAGRATAPDAALTGNDGSLLALVDRLAAILERSDLIELEVAVGQVIGLIEAMKLFNEIKSDRSGRVVRVLAESGQLVKAKQPLIEVAPL
jgi:acetyl-CoA carboxylase biotin carboxyl carrier protein